MPSACVGSGPDKAYYEPSHGSAPDIGSGVTRSARLISNPYSMINGVFVLIPFVTGTLREVVRTRLPVKAFLNLRSMAT